MKYKRIVIVTVVVVLLVGWDNIGLSKEIRQSILFDDETTQVENTIFRVDVGPETVKGGEGIDIRVKSLENSNHVYATFPNPEKKDKTLRVPLENDEGIWVMPQSWLLADGRVVYGSKPNESDVVEGERAIYTPFDWGKETVPIKIDDGNQEMWVEVNVEGNLKESIVVRPVDPRHPFPYGLSSAWEDYLGVFCEVTDWWVN